MRCIVACFVIVNQLRLFAVNIKEYHWLVHQPITSRPRYYALAHYTVNGTIRTITLPQFHCHVAVLFPSRVTAATETYIARNTDN